MGGVWTNKLTLTFSGNLVLSALRELQCWGRWSCRQYSGWDSLNRTFLEITGKTWYIKYKVMQNWGGAMCWCKHCTFHNQLCFSTSFLCIRSISGALNRTGACYSVQEVWEGWAILTLKSPPGSSGTQPEHSARENTWSTGWVNAEWTNEWKGSWGL